MNKEETEQRLKEVYAARLANDVPRILPLFAADAQFRLAASDPQGLFPPPASTAEERSAVIRVLVGAWEWLELRDLNSVIAENATSSRYTLRARHIASGQEMVCEMCDQVRFDDEGKVTEFVEFVDTAAVERFAARLGGQPQVV